MSMERYTPEPPRGSGELVRLFASLLDPSQRRLPWDQQKRLIEKQVDIRLVEMAYTAYRDGKEQQKNDHIIFAIEVEAAIKLTSNPLLATALVDWYQDWVDGSNMRLRNI